jgi:sugar lactone lactonase YvrE
MRYFGHKLVHSVAAISLAGFFSILNASLAAQTAPYLLPYTVSTFAGPHAAYSGLGATCGSLFTLDTAGDGCLASQVSIGGDPHDIRVDNKGNVFFLDNGSTNVVHKISPFNQQMTIFAGTQNTTASKACTAKLTTYGDGCPSTDGAANANLAAGSSSSNGYTAAFKANRGLGLGFNGDVYIAGYTDDYDHRIAASTLINGSIQYGYMQLVMGSPAGTTGSAGTPPSSGSVPVATSSVNSTRGIGADPNGNVFVADFSNNILRRETNGTVYNATALNASSPAATVIQSNVLATNAQIAGPEDAQSDPYGNIFIAEFTNKIIRMIYNGGCTGTCTSFFGIPAASLTVGNTYWIAGYNAIGPGAAATATAYPKDGTTPTIPATQVALGIRKIAVDAHSDLFIADQSSNVIWFVDHATGYIRLLAGYYGGVQPATGVSARGCSTLNPAGNTVGDGCAGSNAGFNFVSSNAGIGNSPDNQGNLYLTDPEGSGNSAGSRIRKILSGLNFPATATGASVTQSIDIHFAPGDSPAPIAYTLTANGTDYTLGTAACTNAATTPNADGTDDCVLPITFAPTVSGPDNATLTVTSTKGGVASFTITGTGTAAAIAFDPGNTAKLATISNSQGMAIDGAGNAYIADTGSNRVLFYNATTTALTVFAGTGASGSGGNGGLATAATLNAPKAVAIGTDGSVYIADSGNNVIRKVGANGIISLYAGGGPVCAAVTQYLPGATDAIGDGCPATQATFSSPSGLATDAFGSLYIADTGNNLIRQIGTTGFVTVLAGGGTVCATATDSNGDGCAATQTIFKSPTGLVYDPIRQYILVADTGNSIVRKIYLSTTFTNTAGVASNIQANPVTLIAGNGQNGSTIDSNNLATATSLSAPTGVAIDPSGTVYIADTGNSSIRMVTTGGIITTIAGINGASGTGTLPGSAIVTQLAAPGAVSVLPSGTLYIADSGNNRLLSDTRSQITYNFGRTNDGFPSPVQNFTELNIGTPGASAGLPVFTPTPSDPQLSLVAHANSNSSIGACAPGTFASGAICNLQGQFNPTDTNSHSSAFAQSTPAATGLSTSAPVPTITLQGQGAVLTNTTPVVTQSIPATGNAQFGASLTLAVTVTPASCNTADPTAYPTGTIIFIVDGTAGAPITSTGNPTTCTAAASQSVSGLSVGPHSISCQYSGDFYYAGSVCQPTTKTITVAQAGTTSMVSSTNNNAAQFSSTSCVVNTSGPLVNDTTCTANTLSTTVTSSTIGIPTGTVNFFANGVALGSANLGATGVAMLPLTYTYDPNGNPVANTSLIPGAYTLTCTYNGATNYAVSNCPGVSFTVLPQPQALVLTPKGCVPSSLYSPGSFTAILAASCPYGQVFLNGSIVSGSPGNNGIPANTPVDVAVAQGSTTDVTLFITPTNTVTGTLTFACSGLPANSTCTFSPTSIPLTASTAFATPVYTDVTLWTDLQPVSHAGLRREHGNISLAAIIGWPLTLAGLLGLLRLHRRRRGLNGLTLMALAMVLTGSSLALNGCAGPGAYTPNFTTAGNYPITITVTGPNVSQSTVIYFTVTSPGITGQQ